ncbi:uncharacterized protein LY79DRAFT_239041 [Colletotrichum navitas]|uniref:Uncharacterized protein n=1 Tax=Colletotrichum navitas TaxID=681940 RepID=A0AAD8PY17_9PEZI|nr:uncharacterized protein LY79DRAFT_239041 [Colletotrichum navitas]KAK1589717.1 hypothetical protein LY79DRAFT_239041 [Colletotrichum navitas]
MTATGKRCAAMHPHTSKRQSCASSPAHRCQNTRRIPAYCRTNTTVCASKAGRGTMIRTSYVPTQVMHACIRRNMPHNTSFRGPGAMLSSTGLPDDRGRLCMAAWQHHLLRRPEHAQSGGKRETKNHHLLWRTSFCFLTSLSSKAVCTGTTRRR